MFSRSCFILVALSFCLVANADSEIQARERCSNDFTSCRPKGASAVNAPGIGSSLSTLLVDLLDSINKVQNIKRETDLNFIAKDTRAMTGSICCRLYSNGTLWHPQLTMPTGADGTQCLLLQGYALPFCYVSVFTTRDRSMSEFR